ncbi:hypothetical protein AB6H32_23140 [Providencia hangzhouensis]|nr:hypothetical protein [Providencia rettgeri]
MRCKFILNKILKRKRKQATKIKSNCFFMDSHVNFYRMNNIKNRAKKISAIRYEKNFSFFIDYFRRSLSIISPSMVIFLIITFIGQLNDENINSFIDIKRISSFIMALFFCFVVYILYRDGFHSKPRPKIFTVKLFYFITFIFFMGIIGLTMVVGVINGTKLKIDLYTEKVSNEKNSTEQPIENNVISCIAGNNVNKK